MIAPPDRAFERENTRRKSPCPCAPRQGQTRVQRFLRRIDDHLAALADAARRRNFLEAQVKGGEARYSPFLPTQGAGCPVPYPPAPTPAPHFLLTIPALPY